MNFLAHFYLSGSSPSLLTGNFLGDFVKGKHYLDYSPAIAKGIVLHREIDSFTDAHKVVHQSKQRLVPNHGHFSGVIVDMFYDHILAVNWEKYSDVPLKRFADFSYKVLNRSVSFFPVQAKRVAHYMTEHNWLLQYAEIEGIATALRGISRRTKFESNMAFAADDLVQNYEFFEQEFEEYFPLLIKHTEPFRM